MQGYFHGSAEGYINSAEGSAEWLQGRSAELVTEGWYVFMAETFEGVVEVTGRAIDSMEPRSDVCGPGCPGIAKNDDTLY